MVHLFCFQLNGSGTTSFSDCIFNAWDHQHKVYYKIGNYRGLIASFSGALVLEIDQQEQRNYLNFAMCCQGGMVEGMMGSNIDRPYTQLAYIV